MGRPITKGPVAPGPLLDATRARSLFPRFDACGLDRNASGLDLRSVGTFTRSGEKGGQSSASALSWYATDARCMEDRGDGAGSLLVLEGAYKQWVVRNRDYGDAAWTKTSWNAGTPLIAAPDGVTEAQPQSTAITSNACRAIIGITGSDAGIPDASRVCHSVWAVDAAGEVFRFRQTGQDNVVSNSADVTPLSSWRRFYWGTSAGTGATTMQTGLQNGASAALRAWDAMWCHQFDVGQHFPFRTVRTAGSQVDIAADSLTLDAGQAGIFLGTGFRLQEVSFDGADTERDQSLAYDLVSVDANNRLSLRHDGSNWRISAYDAGAVVAESAPLAWSAYALLGNVDVDADGGVISVDGVPGTVGTAWSWPSGAVRVGGRVSGTNELRGRIHPVVVAV